MNGHPDKYELKPVGHELMFWAFLDVWQGGFISSFIFMSQKMGKKKKIVSLFLSFSNLFMSLRQNQSKFGGKWKHGIYNMCPSQIKPVPDNKKTYLISVSSSTTISHLVFGTELLRNLWRMANVLPQWPTNRDMHSIHWPVQLNHILTICCILVYRDKWPWYSKKTHTQHK